MRYKLLGNSGLKVSEICLGTMTFGKEWGWGASKEQSKKIYDTYLKAGGNFIDTANRYTEGTSEKYLGEFITPERERIVLATKYTLYNKKGDPNLAGNHRKNMVQSVESSLKRLKTDYIDLLYLHAWDFYTPIEEVMRGFDDLVRSGKILYAAVSDTPAWIVSRANTIAELRGWTKFIALQIEYSLLERTPERDLLPMAKNMDIAITAWAPLAGGALTGKYLSGNPKSKRLSAKSKRLNKRNTKITKEVIKVAEEIGCSPAQVAVNWTMNRNQVVIPIVGATKVSQIKDNLGSIDIELSTRQLKRLNSLSEIDIGFPHEFLSKPYIRSIITGDSSSQIDNHRE
jgi:aryl-alcohol dehydrogenase-like predicted oxidoreductase